MKVLQLVPVPFLIIAAAACGSPVAAPSQTSSAVTPLSTEGIGPTPESRGESSELRFLALGDSYTIGQDVDVEERWPVQLVRRLREEGVMVAEPEIIARTGWTTAGLSAGIESAAPEGPYQLVGILIGVNNQFRGLGLDEFRAEFVELLERAVALADDDPSRVVVVSIPDWGVTPFAEGRDRVRVAIEIDLFNRASRQEAERVGAKYVDVTSVSREARIDWSLIGADGLHPSGKMYRLWVDLILPEARTALEGQ